MDLQQTKNNDSVSADPQQFGATDQDKAHKYTEIYQKMRRRGQPLSKKPGKH